MSCKYRKEKMEGMATSLAASTGCTIEDARSIVNETIHEMVSQRKKFRDIVKTMPYYRNLSEEKKRGDEDDFRGESSFIVGLPGYGDEITQAQGDRSKIDPTHAFSMWYEDGYGGEIEFACVLPSGQEVRGWYNTKTDDEIDGTLVDLSVVLSKGTEIPEPYTGGEYYMPKKSIDFLPAFNIPGVGSLSVPIPNSVDSYSNEDLKHLAKIQMTMVELLEKKTNILKSDRTRVRRVVRAQARQRKIEKEAQKRSELPSPETMNRIQGIMSEQASK